MNDIIDLSYPPMQWTFDLLCGSISLLFEKCRLFGLDVPVTTGRLLYCFSEAKNCLQTLWGVGISRREAGVGARAQVIGTPLMQSKQSGCPLERSDFTPWRTAPGFLGAGRMRLCGFVVKILCRKGHALCHSRKLYSSTVSIGRWGTKVPSFGHSLMELQTLGNEH